MADDLSTRGIERQRRRMTSDLGEPAAKADGPLSEADEQWLRDHPDLQSTPVARLLATLDRDRAARGGEGLREAIDYVTAKRAFDKKWHQDNCPERGDFQRWYADKARAWKVLDAKFDALEAALAASPTTENTP